VNAAAGPREAVPEAPAAAPPVPEAGGRRGGRWSAAASGAVLAMLLWTAARELGIQAVPVLRNEYVLPVVGLLGALLGARRLHRPLWIAGGVVAAGLLVVAYTPVSLWLMKGLVRSDPLERADAVVVLASDIRRSGGLTDQAQRRLIRAYQILRSGTAPRLVVTRLAPPSPSYLPVVSEQMRTFSLACPVEETGPIRNTRDEAREVAALCRERGWRRVVLVTDPTHTRRAGAVFERAGVPVLCSPCGAYRGVVEYPERPSARLKAFQECVWEVVGIQVYRLRGWI
jgi:uncharacterized SAM-binding protein YcdF (DUF218 family)